MSHWRACAAARDVADHELRAKYVEALEILFHVRAALDCDPDEAAMIDTIAGLKLSEQEAEDRVNVAEARLEERLSAEQFARESVRETIGAAQVHDIAAIRLREELARFDAECTRRQAENAELSRRLEAVQGLVDSYSDMLAMARTFVTKAGAAGVKTRHVREAKRPKAGSK